MKRWGNTQIPVNVSRRDMNYALNTSFSPSDINLYTSHIRTYIGNAQYGQDDFCDLYANIIAEYEQTKSSRFSHLLPASFTGHDAKNSLRAVLKRIQDKLESTPEVVAKIPKNARFKSMLRKTAQPMNGRVYGIVFLRGDYI